MFASELKTIRRLGVRGVRPPAPLFSLPLVRLGLAPLSSGINAPAQLALMLQYTAV